VGVLTAAGTTSLSQLTIGQITTAIQNVAAMRAQNGASQNRLGFATELLTVNKANLEAANSRIMDVDVARKARNSRAGTSSCSPARRCSPRPTGALRRR